MKYICNLPEAPQFYSSYGSFMHKILEAFYKGEMKKEDLYTHFLCGFSGSVQGERPSDTVVSNYIEQGSAYLKTFRPFELNTVAVEKKYDFDLGGFRFTGFVDYIGEKDGELYVVDHKSKALKPRSKRGKPTKNDEDIDLTLRQLYLYAEAIRQEYGKLPAKLCINCFRNGNLIEEDFDEKAHAAAINWAKESVEAVISAEAFPPHIEFFPCKYICGLSDECCYWDGGDSNAERG